MDDARPDPHGLPGAPDFWPHEAGPAIRSADAAAHELRVVWEDGLEGRFNRFWLRENEVAADVVDPVTRERAAWTDAFPADLALTAVEIDAAGAVALSWSPDGHLSRHHPGWLRRSAEGLTRPDALLPDRTPWTAAEMPEPPSFDGPSVLEDEAAFGEALRALRRSGFARLRNLPTEEGTVLDVARRIGTVRASNFGYVFRVEAKPDPDSSAYTNRGLEAHTDLASREIQPGLQFLHCLENNCQGGASTMADGFAIAERIRAEDPAAFDALSSLSWIWSNRHVDSDYRFSGPVLSLRDGAIDEVRFTAFLRADPDMPTDDLERAYRALHLFAALAGSDDFVCRSRFEPGDLVVFDNRRILHGRDAYETGGVRRLEGCYMEHDELFSRLRVLARRGR